MYRMFDVAFCLHLIWWLYMLLPLRLYKFVVHKLFLLMYTHTFVMLVTLNHLLVILIISIPWACIGCVITSMFLLLML